MLSEEKLMAEVFHVPIKGRPDLYANQTVEDYKITSVFSFLLGEKQEWENQLNVYAWLFRKVGFLVNALRINAILRDWMKSKAMFDAEYPQIPFYTVPVKLWTPERSQAYVEERVTLHKMFPMTPCTPEERWQKPTTWAVKKAGGDRALRGGVQDSEKAAQKFMTEYLDKKENKKAKLEIEYRPGGFTKCEEYCIVADHCPIFHPELKK